LPDFVHNVTHDLSHSYTLVFLTVAVLVALTYIPAVLLPRRPVQEAAGQTAAPASAISEHQPRVGTTRVDPAGWQRHTGVGPGSAPVDAEYALLPAVGWRARFTGTSEVDTAEQQRWIGTIRVGRQGWEQPGAGRGGAPVYREYALPPAVGWRTVNGNGNGDARASFDGAGSADTAQQQRWIGTYRVDRQGWEQPGAGPVYRQSSLLPAVGWRARFRGIREAVAGMGRIGACHDGRA
jgi:hypothetical protein